MPIKRTGKASGRGRVGASVAREVGHGVMLLAVSGCSVGGFLGMLALASRALGR